MRRRIDASKEAAIEWLDRMALPGSGSPGKGSAGFRFSDSHDPRIWPGMLLPATYDAVACLVLLDAFTPRRGYDAAGTSAFLASFQTESGAFRLPGMRDEDCFKRPDPAYTREYIDFHATNYATGALRLLGVHEPRRLAFMDAYLSPDGLSAWIARRGWDDPWMEGNAVVNLGGFYISLMEDGDTGASERLAGLMDWLDEFQDPETGFWGESFATRRDLLYGFAGAMHTFHLYYRLDRPLHRMERIAESCLSLAREELAEIASACLDIDIVDALANLHRLGHRRVEIEDFLTTRLRQLLDFQNSDGGFADTKPAPGSRESLSFDGWVRGYSEPQGFSNCFATWFRCIAIGMIDRTLFPGDAASWKFRDTVGIGYFPDTH